MVAEMIGLAKHATKDLISGAPVAHLTGPAIRSSIPEVLLIEPRVFRDHRGSVFESFRAERYAAYGITRPFVQDNVSYSTKGVLRGLHLQNPHCQGKLVSVLRGRVLDVAVDVRLGSPTFGKHVVVELSDENRCQIWMPRGFAHGLLVLSDCADVIYKCDECYSPSDEITVRWDDPAIGINWGIKDPILSPRDASAETLADVRGLPVYGEC
jgi:dTDP-4-dehydrorhamnose 3,5-epimerase